MELKLFTIIVIALFALGATTYIGALFKFGSTKALFYARLAWTGMWLAIFTTFTAVLMRL